MALKCRNYPWRNLAGRPSKFKGVSMHSPSPLGGQLWHTAALQGACGMLLAHLHAATTRLTARVFFQQSRRLERLCFGPKVSLAAALFDVHCAHCRRAIKQQIDAPELAAELKSFGASVWVGKAVNVVKHVWAERGATACSEVQRLSQDVLNIGQASPLHVALAWPVQCYICRSTCVYHLCASCNNLHLALDVVGARHFSKQRR